MAKSKLVEANEKIAEGVVGSYKKMEEGVVGGYKKIEESAVGGFHKIADKFVGNFLTKEGESVEEAKERMEERQGLDYEKEYVCSNDFGNHRGDFICIGNVHGFDTGVECVSAGRRYGSGRGGRFAGYGAGMEENGKQGSGQAV